MRSTLDSRLFNLWYAYHTLTCDKRPDENVVANVIGHLKNLDSSVSVEQPAQLSHEAIIKAWTSVKEIEGIRVFLEPSPQLDSDGHCSTGQ